jgi:hypothetical protein
MAEPPMATAMEMLKANASSIETSRVSDMRVALLRVLEFFVHRVDVLGQHRHHARVPPTGSAA